MSTNDPIVDVVIAAAGSGERLGVGVPKAFVDLDGAPMVRYALDAAAAIGARHTVVTVPAHDADDWIERVRALSGTGLVDAVAGGTTRQQSVLAGLQALRRFAGEGGDDQPMGVVLVHDAARPCASPQLWQRVAARAASSGGAIPVVPAVDTLKKVDGSGAVVATIDRAGVVRAQTPQGFDFEQLLDAHRAARDAGVEVTDDAALFERSGRAVATVAGDEANIKVTDPRDLRAAARTLRGEVTVPRVGYGYDVHPLVAGRRLVLGGVEIDHERGLDGHSDADALAHAVTDALLGAAGMGDIGQKFPASDPRWKDADSLALLATTVADLAGAGFVPHQVDATILAEEPRLVEHLATMRERLAGSLGLSPDAVNVKATRGEGLGPIGRGEGIAAHAVATVLPRG